LPSFFDQELYRSDIRTLQDIEDLKWKSLKDVTGYEPFADSPPWAFTIHHTIAPIYLHNYFMGDMMCDQMRLAYEKTGGSEKGFGRFWKEKVLDQSGRYPFLELYRKICGGDPDLGAYLDRVIP